MRFVKLSLLTMCLLASWGWSATSDADETLFQSNFSSTPWGHRPAHVQAIGTATVDGAPQSVLVQWTSLFGSALDIYRPGGPAAGFRGRFSHFYHDGTYNIHIDFDITQAPGLVATVEFEPRHIQKPGPLEFLRIDLLQNGRVRFDGNHIDSDLHFFGDSFLWINIILNINPSRPTVHLEATSANGVYSTDYEIQPALRATAQQFGSFRISVEPPAIGEIDVGEISVSHCQC